MMTWNNKGRHKSIIFVNYLKLKLNYVKMKLAIDILSSKVLSYFIFIFAN